MLLLATKYVKPHYFKVVKNKYKNCADLFSAFA